jgi:alkanesulfonate monooxygenase SsuD/methylene tetrahydromethanopterin reductase-like flavin-dependent oxidoreductase (luciferase family)
MQIGCHLPSQGPVATREVLTTLCRQAEQHGMASLWVSVGWWREEFAALGIPFQQRGRRADEILQIFKALWTQEAPSFHGTFYQFRDIGFAPKPLQQPHPPLWIGGHSQAAYHRAVAFGDGWHASHQGEAPAILPHAAICAMQSTSAIGICAQISMSQDDTE